MEIEHKHDTEDVIHKDDLLHMHPSQIKHFRKNIDKEYESIQKKAYGELGKWASMQWWSTYTSYTESINGVLLCWSISAVWEGFNLS